MKILTINSVDYGSTGNIAKDIVNYSIQTGYSNVLLVPKTRQNILHKDENVVTFGSILTRSVSSLLCWISGYDICFNFFNTISLLLKINKYKPDIIHLHNLHNMYLNVGLFFKYLKAKQIRVIWTLHDCWAMTGHCPHFSFENCQKWKTGCFNCEKINQYPSVLCDKSKSVWIKKKKYFSSIERLIIVTPSLWLKDLVKQSYLGNFDVKVINNGINLCVFKPTKSDIRTKLGIRDDQIMILGVAFGWNSRKGLDDFINIAKQIDSKVYRVVLVGTDDEVDKILPKTIISIHRTHNQHELVELYSSADLFLNPTREEVLGLVNIEAQACGLFCVAYNTGGVSECFNNESGKIVKYGDFSQMLSEVISFTPNRITSKLCIENSKRFDRDLKLIEYVELYANFA